ncbi:hypothetical protein AMTRI_Chr04g180970 [Amborella trichopoda]
MRPFPIFGGLVCDPPTCNGFGAILAFVAILNRGLLLLPLSCETTWTLLFFPPFIVVFLILYCRHHPFSIFTISCLIPFP